MQVPDSASEGPPPGFVRLPLRPSGFLDTLGPFYGQRDGDRLIIGLRIEPRHCNSAGQAHGGMLMSLVDVVLTVASNFNAGTSRFLPTVTATCDFLRGVPEGTWLQGDVEVLRVASSHVFSQLVLTDGVGAIHVRASGILLLRGDPDPVFHRDSLIPLSFPPSKDS